MRSSCTGGGSYTRVLSLDTLKCTLGGKDLGRIWGLKCVRHLSAPWAVHAHRATGSVQPSNAQFLHPQFEGQSETMDRFRAWAIDPSNRRGTGPPAMRPMLPFDGTTTNQEMFKGWQLPPKR